MGRRSDAKQKLLAAAFELFLENSYGGVSVDEICERAKVLKGSFYYFFRTKEDIAVAACEDHWRARQSELDRLFSPQVKPLERLSKWCDYVYQAQKDKSRKHGRVCGCPTHSIGVELATQQEKIRTKAEEMMSRTVQFLERAIVDAKREGLVSAENANAAAQQVYSFVIGTIAQAKIQNDVEVLHHLEPTVRAIIGARMLVPDFGPDSEFEGKDPL
jgi:TetR/AcrR family transcriptional repressor of nem operon